MEEKETLDLREDSREIIEKDEEHNIVAEKVWGCQHCNNGVVYDSKDIAIEHADNCLFNVKHRSCFLCEHLQVIQRATYPKNINNKDYEVRFAIGTHSVPYCKKHKMKLEVETFKVGCEQYTFSDGIIDVEHSDDWYEQQELIDKAHQDNLDVFKENIESLKKDKES